MNNSWDHLRHAREVLAGLEKILAESDPASGVSFSVRRGVAKDNEVVEDDDKKRPWVTIEVSEPSGFGEVLRALLISAMNNVNYWTRVVRRDIELAQAVLAEGATK